MAQSGQNAIIRRQVPCSSPSVHGCAWPKTTHQMNIIDPQFTAINTEGERFTQLDCPGAVATEIRKAITRHRLSGSVYSGGSRYDWRFDSPQYVTLELTRDGEIEDQIPLPATGWAAFVLCAVRRGVDPKEWLTTLLAQGLAIDIEIRAMVEWLFPTKEEEPAPASSPEIQRFESIQREFHGAEAAV